MLIENNLQSSNFFKYIYFYLNFYLINLYHFIFFTFSFFNIKNNFLIFINNIFTIFFSFFNNFFFNLLSLLNNLIFNYQTIFLFNYFYEFNFKNAKLITANIPFQLNFFSLYFSTLDAKTQFLLNNEETSTNSSRYHKFDNPIFKYDYKSGDYFPKLYKEVYTFLFSTLIDLTGGLRQAP